MSNVRSEQTACFLVIRYSLQSVLICALMVMQYTYVDRLTDDEHIMFLSHEPDHQMI